MFSEAAIKELEAIRAKYPSARGALLPAIYIAQREFGHLSPQAYEAVSAALGVPKATVRVLLRSMRCTSISRWKTCCATLHECLLHDTRG